MGLRPRALVLPLVALLGGTIGETAHAMVPRRIVAATGGVVRPVADTLTAMPAAHVKPLRAIVTYQQGARATRSWQQFATRAGGRWDVSWDAATGVPSRIFGSGIAVPGANASPQIAEVAARQVLADHLALLAPGASIGDFQLVSNSSDGDIRSIGFIQRVGGRRVVGGQVSFRFKRDRLFVIGSEALPNVSAAPSLRTSLGKARLARADLVARATVAMRKDLALATAPISAPGEEVILPLVGDAAVLGYRVAVPMTIDGGGDGKYLTYVDPVTGELLAVHQQNLYANGTISFRGVDRYPGRGRVDLAAPRLRVKLDGVEQTTSPTGGVSWSPDTARTATLGVKGALIEIINKANANGDTVTSDLSLAPNGTIVWDASTTEADDAQLVTYLAANTVKEFVRQHVDANLPRLDDTMVANVNIQQSCNAFFDGTAINFFASSAECENTGRIDDVIFHEYGHNLHTFEIIDGVGSFDGAMSEGAADFLAASITNDSGMGRGFFRNDNALRELDPVDSEHVYPRDVGEIHTTGIIFGGTFWDLRKALIAQYGDEAGRALALKFYVGALRRSTSIPSSLVEVLATDDDDGNLDNGTPNECLIRGAFGQHGMRTASGAIVAPATLDENALATPVQIGLTGLVSRCTGDEVAKATLSWRPSYTGMPTPGQVDATRTGDASFYGQIALALDESVMYRATIQFADQTELVLADNLADPYYQLYQGHTKVLYCTNFDDDPFAHGWTTGTLDVTSGAVVADPAAPWAWGVPPGTGATDPPAAFTGTHALVQGLGTDYIDGQTSWVETPEIDVGHYSDVRLQYRRWLAAEDSYYDEAQILANGHRARLNASSHKGDDSSQHHLDREWRIHDVALSGVFTGPKLKVRFDLTSDQGLALGGWAIDDLCIVANTKSICGDGIKSPTEVCDDGANNTDEPVQGPGQGPARCRTYCRLPTCGDNIVDDNEACDAGPDGSELCSTKCEALAGPIPVGCGCQSSDGAPVPFALGAVVGALLLRRRRR
ncbi:MAG: MYXO-CTERM sorting domain-containing protein [Proteobacteria bacterium]|nr:MYXO-CTERM sorting domain-containing protein [Pseudomonadota bacterium]